MSVGDSIICIIELLNQKINGIERNITRIWVLLSQIDQHDIHDRPLYEGRCRTLNEAAENLNG
jgi:hypothetical protein